jgi:hypothetical protein
LKDKTNSGELANATGNVTITKDTPTTKSVLTASGLLNTYTLTSS